MLKVLRKTLGYVFLFLAGWFFYHGPFYLFMVIFFDWKETKFLHLEFLAGAILTPIFLFLFYRTNICGDKHSKKIDHFEPRQVMSWMRLVVYITFLIPFGFFTVIALMAALAA